MMAGSDSGDVVRSSCTATCRNTYDTSVSRFYISDLPTHSLMPLEDERIPSAFSTKIESMESHARLDSLSTHPLQEFQDGASHFLTEFVKCKPYLKPPKQLEYPDEVSDGEGGMRKRRRSFWEFFRAEDKSVKKRKMTEAWDPKREIVINLLYSTMLKRKKDRVDDKGNPISRATASGRVIVAYDDDRNPISRSKVHGRAIVAYDDDGNPLSRSKVNARAVVAYDDDGMPISRSKAYSRSIIDYDDNGSPISQNKACKRAILGYDNGNRAVSRSVAWQRYIRAVPKANRIPKTGFSDWCYQNLTSEPVCES